MDAMRVAFEVGEVLIKHGVPFGFIAMAYPAEDGELQVCSSSLLPEPPADYEENLMRDKAASEVNEILLRVIHNMG